MNNETKILQILETMQSNIAGIQSDISTIRSDITSVQSDIGTMRSDMTSVQSDISTMRTDITSAQSDITSLKDGQRNLELRLENEAFAPIRILSENVIELGNRQASSDESIKFLASTMSTVAHKIDDHTERLERIEEKIESHDIQIEVLDRTKTNKRKAK